MANEWDEDEEAGEDEGPPNDDWINRAYMDQAGPNPTGKDRPAMPHWTSTFNDRRKGSRR